jgi:hypothetical protein
MARFSYDDTVRIVRCADEKYKPGAVVSIIGIFKEKPSGSYFEEFPPGTIYTIEYENGEAIDIHESLLEPMT